MMKHENMTAEERIFEIQQELAGILALIDHARLSLSIVPDDMDDDACMAKVDEDLHLQILSLADVIRNLDRLRLDLLDGTQEVIA